MNTIQIALLATAGLVSAGCAAVAVGTGTAVGVAAVQEKTMGEAVDDATTSNEIKTRLLASEVGDFTEVDVEVSTGLVLLTGRVNTPEERVEAERLAWTSTRALDVANEIQIEPPGGFTANVSDEVITARVRSRLVGSSTVRSINFNIETYDGVVYLMGLARSNEELQKAAQEASYVGGVKQVVSYVRVRPSGTPASATGRVVSGEDELAGGPAG
jgi:osmotically-inducible protein OsmY